MFHRAADGSNAGTTAEDRFFGARDPGGGIVAIKLSNTVGGIEVDHIQYGGFPAPPVPALALFGTVLLSLLLLLSAGLVGNSGADGADSGLMLAGGLAPLGRSRRARRRIIRSALDSRGWKSGLSVVRPSAFAPIPITHPDEVRAPNQHEKVAVPLAGGGTMAGVSGPVCPINLRRTR